MGPVTLSGVFSGSAEYFVEQIMEIQTYNDDSIDDEEEIPEEEYDKPYVSLAHDMGGLKGYVEAYMPMFIELEQDIWMYETLEDELLNTTMRLMSNEEFDFNPQRNYDYLQYLFLDVLFGDFQANGTTEGPTLRQVWLENTKALLAGFDLREHEEMPEYHDFNIHDTYKELGIEPGDDREGAIIKFTDESNVQHLASCFDSRGYIKEQHDIEDLIVFGVAPEGNLNYGMMTRGYMFVNGPPDRMLYVNTSAYRNNAPFEETYEWYVRHLDILEGRLLFDEEAMEYVAR